MDLYDELEGIKRHKYLTQQQEYQQYYEDDNIDINKQVRINKQRKGVEIVFKHHPEARGFKWSYFYMLWYGRLNKENLMFAHEL